MKVLIIENEIYLAQSISMKLSEIGYWCEIINSFDELKDEKTYDVILLSTNTNNFINAVEKFKSSIIILLISYISTDTVSDPLKMGASDYIQKPFMMEELLRKIKHHQDFRKLLVLNNTYESYFKSHFKNLKTIEYNYKKIKFPLIIQTNNQDNADFFVFSYMKKYDLIFSYIDLLELSSLEKIFKLISYNNIIYISNFQILKNTEKEKILNFIKDKMVILHTSTVLEKPVNFDYIDLRNDEKNINNNEILTIDEYVKYIILTYQNIFPDTDLSKKLGISRKSLWEKRKKYEISKRK
ncbi:response regulator [Campylobacter sp. 2018MI35]|uniref:response regulator n=1 Tax=Campylobacter sp. 2018MI34 TaxID=2800582 RepID=UPI001904D13F|nr:response regulator [Campylobacter sp. 2018MI34]MBK1991909.1 response regulator [Campylobacter sp. 2018MI34]